MHEHDRNRVVRVDALDQLVEFAQHLHRRVASVGLVGQVPTQQGRMVLEGLDLLDEHLAALLGILVAVVARAGRCHAQQVVVYLHAQLGSAVHIDFAHLPVGTRNALVRGDQVEAPYDLLFLDHRLYGRVAVKPVGDQRHPACDHPARLTVYLDGVEFVRQFFQFGQTFHHPLVRLDCVLETVRALGQVGNGNFQPDHAPRLFYQGRIHLSRIRGQANGSSEVRGILGQAYDKFGRGFLHVVIQAESSPDVFRLPVKADAGQGQENEKSFFHRK